MTEVELNFVEEPLGIPADQGHGYLRVEFGGSIDPEKRFKIIRKLGWGMNSSIWMAYDEIDKKYIAIKVLKGYSTGLFERGVMLELPALERSTLGSPPPGLTSIKRIMMHTLRGLAHMYALQIVHTDLKQDNIMFDMGSLTQADIAAIIEADPTRRHPPEEGLDCVVQAAVSQPLPLPSLADAMTRNYIVADFGSAQPANVHTTDEIFAYALRAPETILKSPWNEKVDIWAFGCMPEPKLRIFELLTDALLHMTRVQVESSRLGTKYFILDKNIDNPFCNFKADVPIFDNPFAASLRNYKVIKEEDVIATAKIMQRCLRLNPDDRATAMELLQDPWWQPE
ncbi:kinase-like protein [Suillus subalutaceus]|uniref:kinase-like protein n=1 Tax=Suillus subalutaceus TaxID=48586 RepID=UPI001B85D574|nr:kinase-like protein [Suillus subalutaceus]KAG1855329.1 kinase-like protein [Suillus subalutaceus]